jgi:5-hydroxyisourate hydrolase
MPGRLTTHVLDTTHGLPAAHITIQLWRIDTTTDTGRVLLKTVSTNDNGQTDEPLLAAEEMVTGVYELLFAVGTYFARQLITVSLPPFLDEVPVRFGIADAEAHYHVPLLISPWAYSIYRGS